MSRKPYTLKCESSGFSPNSNKCSCDYCLAERARWQRDYRKKRPDVVRRMNLRKYGLSIEEYKEKEKDQNFLCAVCYKPERHANQHSIMSLSVDHNHTTGEVRGLLCSQCNRALGLLDDSASVIENLLTYRRKYE